MTRSRWLRACAAATVITLAMFTAACAPAATETQQSQAAEEQTETENGNETVSDGPVDPEQETRRTGPAAEFGGPPNGGQGLELLESGAWCEAVAVFWGGEVPQGVTFTFEGITSDPSGVELAPDQSVCGSSGAEVPCIGLDFPYDAGTVFCTMQLQPADDFQNGTVVDFTGTLDCLSTEICDAMAARDRGQGPLILICDPVFIDAGNECVPLSEANG